GVSAPRATAAVTMRAIENATTRRARDRRMVSLLARSWASTGAAHTHEHLAYLFQGFGSHRPRDGAAGSALRIEDGRGNFRVRQVVSLHEVALPVHQNG